MKLTVKKLKSLDACDDAIQVFKEQKERDVFKVFALMLGDKKYQWANWLIVRLLKRKNKIRYTIYAAEQCLDKFEQKYPNNKRPRLAIKAAKKVVKKDNEENRDAAFSAVSAASAASAAFSAAQSVARSAASAAQSAAFSAAQSAASAAFSAASAAFSAAYEKIIKYGIGLLKKQELQKLKGKKNETM